MIRDTTMPKRVDMHHMTVLVPIVAMATIACGPTYAPPVRSGHHGTPGRMQQGHMEIAGDVAGPAGSPSMGGLSTGVVVEDWLEIQTGVDASLLNEDLSWTMGWMGLALTGRQGPVAMEVEVGLGGGAGGQYCEYIDDCKDRSGPWYRRPAFGAYFGAGVGLHLKWFSFFGRMRFQVSNARDVPTTMWASGVAGVQISILRSFHIHFGAGRGGYWNEKESMTFDILDMGVSISFNVIGPGKKGIRLVK